MVGRYGERLAGGESAPKTGRRTAFLRLCAERIFETVCGTTLRFPACADRADGPETSQEQQNRRRLGRLNRDSGECQPARVVSGAVYVRKRQAGGVLNRDAHEEIVRIQ